MRGLYFFGGEADANPAEAPVIAALEGVLSLAQYRQLPSELQLFIATHLDDTLWLIKELGATFDDIKKLSPAELYELSNYRDAVTYMHIHTCISAESRHQRAPRMPIQELLKIDPAARSEIIRSHQVFVMLVNFENVDFYKISGLTVSQLQTIFRNPESPEAQEILHPPSVGCSIS